MIFSGGCQETKDQKSLFVFLFYFLSIGISLKKRKCLIFLHGHFSQVSHKISSSLRIQVNACSSVAQYVKEDVRETDELMV